MQTATLYEKFTMCAICAVAVSFFIGAFAILVAPTIRQLLFASPLWSERVKAQVQEAYIVGSFRTGLVSGSATGQAGDGPHLRDLKFFIVARYPYRGKTYTTRTTALYGESVSLPGSPGKGSDKEYFKTAVARLRQVAPNTAYTFLQSKYSELYREEVERAMAELPQGVQNAEMDLPIVKWVPGWNYYNLPFSDGVRKGPLIGALVWAVCAFFPVFVFIKVLRTGDPPLKDFIFLTWPGWIIGAVLPILITISLSRQDREPPPAKDLDESVPSSQIHRS